jgi:hypothetical protein
MKHSFNQLSMHIQFCQWCGRSMEAIAGDSSNECSGVDGITHINYQRAKKHAMQALQVGVVLPGLVDMICKPSKS